MSTADALHSQKSSPPGGGDIGCDRVYCLLDDYLEYRLSKRDRQRLETHLVYCPQCAKELRTRPALEHQTRLALGTYVQPLRLSPDATTRITRAAQRSVRRGIWLNRAMSAGRVLAGAVSAVLLVTGLFYLLSRTALPWTEKPLFSSKATQLPPPLSELAWDAVLEPRELYPGESFTPIQPEGDTAVSGPAGPSDRSQPLTYGLQFEPGPLQTGEPFTTTVLVLNEQDQPLSVSQVYLDIEGPQHSYHFELAISDPLPAERASALRITPDSLAEASQKRYQVSPDEIIDVPGVYTFRITLFHAVAVSDRQ